MAQYDLTISDNQYDQMVAVLDAMRSKLAPLRVPLAKMLASEPEKVKAFIQTENGRFLREVHSIWKDLNTFFDDIGYGEPE